jgi:hypothetical protein
MSIRETLKMACKMGLVSSLGLEEVYMKVAGTRVRDMEQESIDTLMGVFIKAPGQMMKRVASVVIGMLKGISILALIRMIKGMVST